MLKKKYETAYLFSRISEVVGIRYNIRPDLDDPKEAEVTGLYSKETVVGFFRAYILTPVHMGLVTLVNQYGFLSGDQLTTLGQRAAWPGIDPKKILYECVAYGLLFRNIILFENHTKLDLYGVDTGGYYAMEEAGIKANKVLYTLGIDERLTLYRKAVFLLEENLSSVKGLCMLEDLMAEKSFEGYAQRIILFDSEISKILEVQDQIYPMIKELVKIGAKVVDIGGKCGFQFK